jgi:hypothetical protein
MKKYLANYSDKYYQSSQINNSQTGISIGGFDEVFSYGFKDLTLDFIEKNKLILSNTRGAGYWLWKPYIINHSLSLINEEDILFYSDSGISFIKPVDELVNILDDTKEKILLFELEDFHLNKKWTKRDCFYYMNLDFEPFLSYPQLLASYVIMRKNNFVVNFIKEWLELSQDHRIITDSPNECGLPNYEDFADHRHDQSILSLLGRKYNIKSIPDVSQFGVGRMITNQIVNHHRNRN